MSITAVNLFYPPVATATAAAAVACIDNAKTAHLVNVSL